MPFRPTFTEGFDPHLILIFRRQHSFIESLYNQRIKRGDIRSFKAFIKDISFEDFEWNRICDIFSREFGKENMTVLPFEIGVLNTGMPDVSNIVEAIHSVMGVSVKINLEQGPTFNPNLSLKMIEIQRFANKRLSQEDAFALADLLALHFPKHHTEKISLFTDEMRAEILQRFASSNEKLLSEYLAGFDPTSYLPAS